MKGAKSPIYIEYGARRCFAASLDWPGLCRSGKGDEAAIDALGTYVARYATVAELAGVRFPLAGGVEWEVTDRVPTRSGGADFGAPTAIPPADSGPFGARERARHADLMAASWSYFDSVVAASPPTLRKGPRGGGRDRDAIAAHVAAAEHMFGPKVGLKLAQPADGDQAAVRGNRVAILAWARGRADGVVPQTEDDGGSGAPRPPRSLWPARYAVRRLVWHVLDHAWEVEDRRD